MGQKKQLVRGIIFIVLGIGILLAFIFLGNKDWKKGQASDSVKFKEEYKGVSKDNLFVYKTHNEINEMLEKGTGVIYLGFPSCPWCQAYVPYLDEVAKEVGISEIAYFNILESRKNNTVAYRKTVELLKEFLNTDDEGNSRVYVPEIIVVKDGKILSHNNETSTNQGNDTKAYWTEEKQTSIKNTLKNMLSELPAVCTSCN